MGKKNGTGTTLRAHLRKAEEKTRKSIDSYRARVGSYHPQPVALSDLYSADELGTVVDSYSAQSIKASTVLYR